MRTILLFRPTLFFIFYLIYNASIHAQISPIQSEEMRFKAMTSRDTLTLKNILADSLYYTHSNGLVENKQDFLKSINDKKIIYDSITIVKHTLREYRKSAILTGICIVKGIYKTTPFEVQLRYLSVYIKQSKKWKLAAWQSLKI